MIIFLTVANSKNLSFAELFSKVIIASGFFVGIYGWSQYTTFDIVRILFPWFNENKYVYGTFGNSNLFAIFTAIVLLASLGTLSDSTISNRQKFICIMTFLIYIPFIPRIDFQGRILAIIGIMLFIGFWLALNKNKLFKYLSFFWFAFLSLGLLLMLLAFFKIGPFSSWIADYLPSFRDRVYYWQAAIKIMQDNLLFGVGIDELDYWFREYRLAESVGFRGSVGEGADNVHNVLFQLSSTTGLISTLAYISIIFYIAKRGLYLFRAHQNKILVITISLIWFIYTVQSFISFDNLAIMIIGWVVAGIIVSQSYIVEGKSEDKINFRSEKLLNFIRLKFFKTFFIFLLVFQIFIASSYQINDFSMFAKWWTIKNKLESNELPSAVETSNLVEETLNSHQSRKRMRVAEQLALVGLIEPAYSISFETTRDFPKEVRAWELLGRISYSVKNYRLAVNYWEEALKLDPLNSALEQRIRETEVKID
jgi:tetratricopeptide (TPR) repeat protein